MSRYARQMMLPEVTATGQARLAEAHVLVVGAGGLGAPVLQYLAGAGVGSMTLVDGDRVSLSNLHRQTLFREADIGALKVEAAANALLSLNSEISLETVAAPLDPINASPLVRQATLVLDCADSFAASYILSDMCFAAGVPLISASVLGFAGYVGGFCGGAPSMRAVFPDLPERAQSCATAGVMGPVVGMLGAAQAQMALSCLLKLEPSPLGQIISIDMQTFRTGGFRFDGAPEQPSDAALRFIAASEIAANDFVVDLRDEVEAPLTVVDQAIRMPLDQFRAEDPTPAAGQRAVLTCRSGLRAWQAATHLRSYWTGEISLIAMGDAPEEERQDT